LELACSAAVSWSLSWLLSLQWQLHLYASACFSFMLWHWAVFL
jgi:hypothetical protein